MAGRGIISIELLLDETVEQAVRVEWAALAAAGFSSMAAHTGESNRPHVTLMVRPRIADVPFHEVAARLPLPLTVGPPVLFGSGDRRVLARAVIPSRELLDLHAFLHGLVGAGDDAAHTRPGEWTPHVTLARRLRRSDLAAAIAIVGGALPGRAVSLRRWDSAAARVTALGPAGAH